MDASISLPLPLFWFDKKRKARPWHSVDKDEDRTVDLHQTEKEVLICAACAAPITEEQHRIAINGGHEHAFFNPQGIVYEIGCFAQAPGCIPVSPPSGNFSWFPGFQWRIANCGRCQTHLGWDFLKSEGSAFHGLILSRLGGSRT